jgi:hypothetical protein
MKQLLVFGFLLSFLTLSAQGDEHPHGHHPDPYNDSLPKTLGRDLDKGYFEFHKRSFFMGTINRGDLLDYSGLATGAGLGYFSPEWKGFSFGFSGFFVFQLHQHNVYEQDPTTNNYNRYELLLFDMNDFDNRKDLDRLEELFFRYHKKNFRITAGRQKFDSPFMNEQDNRMRGNIYNGLVGEYKKGKWDLTAALFNHVTIRGTVDWYSIEESYGVYPFGRNPFGTASNYKGNISSLGIGVLGARYKSERWKHQFWNYFNENVFNMTYAQSMYKHDRGRRESGSKKFDGVVGAEGFYHTAISNGGNAEPEMSYIMPNEFTYGGGARMGIDDGRTQVFLNYLHISDNGRFLFPREWGRERFFASIPRERYEGAGGVNSLTLSMKHYFKPDQLYAELFIGTTYHQDLDNIKLNKYGVPSYYHFAGIVDYKFKGYLDGFDIKFMVANKTAHNPNEVEDMYRINRVDLWNFNLILDYRF